MNDHPIIIFKTQSMYFARLHRENPVFLKNYLPEVYDNTSYSWTTQIIMVIPELSPCVHSP